MDEIQKTLLEQVAGLHEIPTGAFNIRANGQSIERNTTANIDIITKEDKQGIDIIIKPGTQKESIHIPVVLSQSGLTEMVYNDFYVGENCDITIIAGCGIHNGGDLASKHDGIHAFYIGKNSHVRYVEKHYGSGDGKGERIMNPQTIVELDEYSHMEMETVQIKGVDSTKRTTQAKLARGAKLVITERLMTHGNQYAESAFHVNLDGEDSSANLISRAVARDNSKQLFLAKINGNNRCAGHSECDAIIMDNAKISAIPEITANHLDAALIHEAAIGKIAGEQIIKLMTLGLTEAEAEAQIVNGFLK
ncbi:MAG: SufD family Fe-S cluster assembly protein [Lachnospiraceae bacterium]|nr:SufD family Fe-S cluster assembly protein [Lachnospiraceae bacterium]